MMDAKERSCSCEQQSANTPCLSSTLRLYHGEALIQEMHQWFQTSSTPCWCTESAEAVYVTVREVCSTVNRSDSVALAILFDSFMIDIANEHIADVMKSYVLLQELSEQYYDELKNVPDSVQQTDITSFWESLHSFHMNLLQTLPNMSNKLLKRLGSLFLRNSLNYNLQNPFRVANCKALNVLIEKCSTGARVIFKNSHMPYFEELPEALQNAGDYDFQSSLVELLFRLSRAKERSASVAKWFPNLPYTYQCLFTRIVDFDPDCRSFLIAFNSHLGTSRLVHTVPALSIFVGGVKIMKPSIESYKKLWMDFNIGSGSVSILFDKGDPSIATPDREWETLIIYKTEVLSVSLVQTLHGQTLNMTLNQSVIDYVYSVFPKLGNYYVVYDILLVSSVSSKMNVSLRTGIEKYDHPKHQNANQSDSFLIAEFNSECEDILKALQVLYPKKLKVVSRLPRPSPYLGTKKKSSVSVGSLHANKYSKSPVNGAASHSSFSDRSQRSRKRVKRLSYSSSGIISKPKCKTSVTSSCVGLKFYSDAKQSSPDDDEIIPSTYTTPGSGSTNVTISHKLKSLENRSLESSKRSRISDQSSYETPKSGRIIKSIGGENRKTIYPDTSPESDKQFTSVEATRGSAAVHDPSPIVEEMKISQSEEIVDPQCTSDVNVVNRQTEDTTSEQFSPAPDTADLAEESKVPRKVSMVERADTVTSLNSSTHLPHLNVDEVIEQIRGPDCKADESNEEAGVNITANVNKQKNEVRSFNDTSLLWSEEPKNSTNALSLRMNRNVEQSESPDYDIISSVSVMSTQHPISEQLLLRRSKRTATEPTATENLNEKNKTSSDEEIIPPTVQPEKITSSKSQTSSHQKNIEKPNNFELESTEISANVDELMKVVKPVDDVGEEVDHSELPANLQEATETVKNVNEANKGIEKENDLEKTYLKEVERNLKISNEKNTLDNEITEKKICSNIVATNENANSNSDCVKLADAEKEIVDEHAIAQELITTEENKDFDSDGTFYNEVNTNSSKRKGDGSENYPKETNGAIKRLKLSTDDASSPTSSNSYHTKDVSHVSCDGQTNVKDLAGNSEKKKECLVESPQSSFATRSVHGCERVEPTKTLMSEEIDKTSSVKVSAAVSDEMIYEEVITDLAEATDNKLENASSEQNNLHNLKELLYRPVVDDVQMRVVTIQLSEKLDILELKSQIVSPVKEKSVKKSVIDSATINISSGRVKRLDESTRLSTTYTISTSEKSGSKQKKRKVNHKNKLPDHYFAGGNKIERMKVPLQVAPDIKTGGGCKRKLFRKTSSILLGTPPMTHSPAKERSLNKSTFTVSGIMPLDQSSVLEESRAQPLRKRKSGKVVTSINDKSCVEVSFVSDCQLEAPKVTRTKRKSDGKREKQFFKRVKSPMKEKTDKKNVKHERLFSMSETSSNCETIYPNTTKDNLLSDKDAHIYSDPPSSDYSWLKSFYTREKMSKKVNQYGKSYLRKAKKSSDDEYSPNKKDRKSRMSGQSKTRTRKTKTTKWPSPLPSRNLRTSNKQKDFKKFASYSSGSSLDDVTEEVSKGNSNVPITSFVSKLEDRSVEIMRDCTHSSYNQSVNLTDYSLSEEKNKKRTSSNVPKINLQPLDAISIDENSSQNKLIDEDLLMSKLDCLKPQKRGRKRVKNINIPLPPFNTPASRQSTPLIREKNMMKGLRKMTANISSIEVVQSVDHSFVLPCNDRILFISDSQGASAPKHQRAAKPESIKSPCEPNPVLDFGGNMKIEVMDEYENIPAERTTFEGSSTEHDDQMQKAVRVSLSRNCSDCSGNVDGTVMNEAKLSSAFDDIFKGSSQNTWSLQCGQKPGIYDVTKLNTKEDNVTPERLKGKVLFQDDAKLSNEDISQHFNSYNSDEIIPATAEDDVNVGNEDTSPPDGISAVVSPLDRPLVQVPLSFLREMKAQRLKEIQKLDFYMRRMNTSET